MKTPLLLSITVVLLITGSLYACHSATDALGHPPASLPVVQVPPAHALPPDHDEAVEAPLVLDLSTLQGLKAIIPKLVKKRVIFVGETHDRYDHHLNQLEILKRIHALNPNLAIGVEWFQQPFQADLDAFIEGDLDEREVLRKTEYYERWRFDYRLYRPILLYARQHHIPIVALNVPMELTRKVGRGGLDSLNAKERAQLPAEIDRSDEVYRERLQKVFNNHPGDGHSFEDFLSVQLLWDEGMAERASEYLKAHPERTLVVFAGSGHLAYGSGIPSRVARRTSADYAIVLSDSGRLPEPGIADYVVMSGERKLPPSGTLGALLDTDPEGVFIRHFVEHSGARAAGLEEGDRMLAIAGEAVHSFADVKMILQDKQPGNWVTVRVRRKNWLFGDKERSFEVELR